MVNRFSITLVVAIILVVSLGSGCKEKVDPGNPNGIIGQSPGEFSQKQLTKKTEIKKKKNSSQTVPRQNLYEARFAPLPDVDTEDAARNFIESLASGKIKRAQPFLINKKIYLLLKNMHLDSKEKEKKIISSMVKKKRTKIKMRMAQIVKNGKMQGSTFESIALGKCKWIAPNKEWNRYGFWQCSQNRIYYHQQGNRNYLKIRKMINWGKRWFAISF